MDMLNEGPEGDVEDVMQRVWDLVQRLLQDLDRPLDPDTEREVLAIEQHVRDAIRNARQEPSPDLR